MAGLGLLNLFFRNLEWRLESQDDDFVLEGQFTTTDLQEDIAASIQEFRSLGRAQPILVWKGEENDRMVFTAVFRTRHNGILGLAADVIENQVKKLRSLPKKVADLGRARIFNFVVGESISFPCLVSNVAAISYEPLRPLTGDLRGVTASISLKRYEPYDPSLSGAQSESLVMPFLPGDSYESLALRAYGSPRLGEALRRRNPETPIPTPGVFIHIPPQAILARERTEVAQSQTLNASRISTARRRAFLTKRNARTYRSHILGPEWTGA